MLLPQPDLTRSPRDQDEGTRSTVGEVLAIAPDTYVVPGWWSSPGRAGGLALGSLVVRGRSCAVVDTAPAPLADDWLAAVLALVDPGEVRWIVASALDPVRAGCVPALQTLAPRATVVVPGRGCATLDLGDGTVVHVHEDPGPGAPPAPAPSTTGGPSAPAPLPAVPPGQLVVEVRHRRLLWTDLVGGPLPRPATDVAVLDDATLVAALAGRPRPLLAGEAERTAALDLRVLASPLGPVARGRSIGRVLDLTEAAEARRPATALPLAALTGPLGREPWSGPAPAP
ncbi:hypothetical protein HC251_24270 [Iamia sp. SCSIO 61187]|uniref:hypothetical protein n=1 Tax=Iamia sp. SCSIO 61187 TaxID=2722752 RepID=UPI001C635365|nr:hypothetical protein [Iamia sp. SCSIO 61187]QYG95237.1 hypothetical protein HC251_24270 [Iamia sp. SCSIO 61187]